MGDGAESQVAIVTGAASGFGRATAIRFAREGARVVVVDLDEERAAATVDEARALGTDARLVVGDVSMSDTAARAVATALDEFGRLDVLVNNAGIAQTEMRDTWDMAEDRWDDVLRVDLRSVYVCSRAAIPAMLAGASRCHRERGIDRGDGRRRRRGLCGGQGRHRELHAPRRERAGESGSAGQLRLARVHALAHDDGRAARTRREPNRSSASRNSASSCRCGEWVGWTTSPRRSCSSPVTKPATSPAKS